jgi:hypothetical protein
VSKKLRYENLKATIPSTDYDRSETNGECGIFQLFGSHYKNDARCVHEIKSRNATAKAAFNRKKTPLHYLIGLKFKGKN